MIQRTPEPELMDDAEQARAYALADFAEVNQGFVDRFVALAPDCARGRIVDLGCGPADIAVRLCRALPEVEVVAVDGACAMLDEARATVEAARLTGRIRLVEGYLPLTPPWAERFDAVISNSLLHHLPDPGVLWQEIERLAAPGAQVLVVDLFRPRTRERASEIVDQYAKDEPEVLRSDFFHSLLAAFTPEEVRAQLADSGFAEALRVETISDRHLAVSGRIP